MHIDFRHDGINIYFHACSEANSLALHGAARVSNTAGAALWLLDHALYAATLGAKRVYYHDGIGYKYNLVRIHLSFHSSFPLKFGAQRRFNL